MSETVIKQSIFDLKSAQKGLALGVKSWFAVALAGQWMFALYIFSVYAVTLMMNIDISDVTPAQGYKQAKGVDLLIFFAHIIPAAYLSFFGLLQFLPKIRSRYPALHRINGRIFLLLGFFGALGGLYLQWGVGIRLSDIGSLGITLNGLLIPVAVFIAWRHAVNKRFDQHMRWATHSFFLVNGVWTFRLYLMGWYTVNQGPNGNTSSLDGPMDIFLSFACYLLPMAFAELYFWGKRQRNENLVWGTSLLMWCGAIFMVIGVSAATMAMWWPRINAVLAMF